MNEFAGFALFDKGYIVNWGMTERKEMNIVLKKLYFLLLKCAFF